MFNCHIFITLLSQGKNGSASWFENPATTYSKIVNGPKSILVGLLSTIFIHSEAWKSIVIKTGSLGLVTKPVCTLQSMEAWFSVNGFGRDAATSRVCWLIRTLLMNVWLDAKRVCETP